MALAPAPTPQPSASSTTFRDDQRAAQLVSHLPLRDGLRICLSLAEGKSPSFGLAALRWHSCFCSRAVGITLREAEDLLTALDGLCSGSQRAAHDQLRNMALRYQQDEAVEVLDRWARRLPTLSA